MQGIASRACVTGENPMKDLFVILSVGSVPPPLSVCELKRQRRMLLPQICRWMFLVSLATMVALAVRNVTSDAVTVVSERMARFL